jgi:RNA polymerase sigma-70 factor (ECF subfamily)
MHPAPAPDLHATLGAIYEAHRAQLLAHLTRLVADRTLAEDLYQETFLKALRHWDQCDRIANVTAWLYRIATNTAYDHLRRRRRITFSSLDPAAPALHDEGAMESRLHEQEPIQRALARLSPDARRLLILCVHAGHTTQELAAALACSDAAVRLRLFRARARFRRIYREIGAS